MFHGLCLSPPTLEVRAVSEWNIAGEWANHTIFPEFPPEDVINSQLGDCERHRDVIECGKGFHTLL